jgi:hypothetical protein
MKRRVDGLAVILASLVACAWVAAACGGDGGSSPGAQPTTDSRTAQASAEVSCSEVPPGAEGSAGADVRYRDDGSQYYLRPYILLPRADIYLLAFTPDTDPQPCDAFVRDIIALSNDSRVYQAAETWVQNERNGELVGACRPDGPSGSDPARDDYCYFLPTRAMREYQMRVGRPQSDDATTLILRKQPDGAWTVAGTATPTP